MDLESLNFTELRDAEIVARMRKCNYEKFKTLVRMHLSFELDLNTDEFDLPCHEIVYEDKGKLKKWNRLSKKHKHGGVMAAALATGSAGCASVGVGHKGASSASGNSDNASPIEGLNQQIDAGFLFHLQELKEFLMLEKNLQQEGIFRKTGSASRQNDLRTQIQNDKPLDLETAGYSAHDCATVFKGYLADLPEPILTDAHYPAHLQIAPLCLGINPHIDDKLNTSHEKTSTASNGERVKKELHVLNSIQLLLLLLPDENRQLLQNIIDMLHAVARQHAHNKMGPDNLATLFAPHLICPRNLPPEALHYLAKKMSSIIAYMIIRGHDIFSVPAKLATDIRAYFLERKRKKTMSPEMTLDDSISDISTVNTVYTFVDREKTAAAHNTNNTDTELAQLYAHIQSMPESSKKRRLIKQFNKQNGQGTPLQLQAMNRVKNTETSRTAKSLSDSIKKHIFHKGIMSRTPKRQPIPAVVLETPNNSSMKPHKQRVLFQSPNPQSFATNSANTTTSSSLTSSSSSVLTTSFVNSANSHTLYNIKTHPLQKSISSTSLLMSQQQYDLSMRATSTKLIRNDEHESLSQHHSNSSCSSSDGFVCKTKSISAPVSRQTSSDLQNHINTSITSTCSSSGLTGGLHQHLDPNCCVTPLKLISEAAKNLIAGANGNGVDKKSVCWDDAHLIDMEHISNPSTPLRQTPSNDLKSRYKSEPNLSLSHNICDTPNSSTALHGQGGYEMITPIAKHVTGRSLTRKLMKGVSMGNLKFPFSTPESTKRLVRTVSSSLKRRSSDDSQIYQQAEGSFAAAIRNGNAPLLQDMDDDDDEDDDDTFEDVACDSETEVDSDGDDNEDMDMLRKNISLVVAAGGSNSSEVANCFGGGPAAYQQLLLQQSSLYHRNLDLVTSTPSLLMGRRSMSPITKSTQRMPKAMQESIMTPRSRKPVMVLTTTTSSTDQNQTINQTYLSDFHEQAEHNDDEEDIEDNDEHDNEDNDNLDDNEDSILGTTPSMNLQNTIAAPQTEIINEDATSLGGYSDIFKRRQLLQANQSFVQQHSVALGLSSDSDSQTNSQSNGPKDVSGLQRNITNADALTEHFKEYLLKRSVLTAPPEDTSFTSHSDDFDSSHEIDELEENQLSSSLLYCLDGNRPEATNDSSNSTTTDNIDVSDDNTEDTTRTNDDTNIQTMAAIKTTTSNTSSSSSNSSSASSSSSSSDNSASSSSSSSNSSTTPHIPLITTNRLANNPFVILNNARKRAATQDLDKISSSIFNSHVQTPPPPIHNSYQTGFKSTTRQLNSPNSKHNANYNLPGNSNSTSNKENCEQNENYVVSKKLLISEYPGETSF
ncbi:serine-rich adhesin for platelets isoform X2 [Calliphora vicina]|uniref:serine-rich adhesin for platelets isoform X2 n=1 Tax=Calliphora vicina TaxID=7373 RepID=UPI00325A91BA